MSLKPQERKEKWERHPGKKLRESEHCVSAEPSENGHSNDAGSSGRETDRGKERVKKKIPLKVQKQELSESGVNKSPVPMSAFEEKRQAMWMLFNYFYGTQLS
ncbi:fibrosin-1-like [Crotalus adamanteus]|uniref:Fibrosin-1-like n=1 Tax=Crotalus adamanteus TaxID=8729 RepID=A0AAW1APV7_CROAD